MKESKIVIENVSKKYKMYNSSHDKILEAFDPRKKIRHTEFSALTDISFSVAEGEIIGIVGRNGAGKSTLLKLITGILKPSSGNIRVSGRISSLLELGTGFNMEYTGLDNIYFYGTLMGLSKEEIDSRVDNIIEFAEIGDYIGQVVKTYSSGMFARLAFSCAINVDPEILIVDEILSVGDMRFQSKCFKKFKEFQDKGVTILYVGHDVGLMRSFCDRCIWLNNGKMVAEGDPKYITSKFTEFMYSDDIDEFTLYKKFEDTKEDKESTKQLSKDKEEVNTDIETVKLQDNVSTLPENSLFPNALAHWGSNIGMVRSVRLLGSDGKENTIYYSDDKLRLEIQFEEDKYINPENLSVAMSIKNKEGTDIIVKTTFDENYELKRVKKHKVSFDFLPFLATGEYYLVVALENRENMNPTYYEYIEGVKFFKVYSEKKIFGIYDVEADIKDEEII